MSLLRNKILTLSILLLSLRIYAQEIEVQDTVFANWLCDRVELAMDATCKKLDTVKAVNEYPELPELALANKGITNANEVVYFVHIDTLFLNSNALTSFPTDLSRFRSIEKLNLNFNKITIAPDIRYTNAVTGDTAVKLFYIGFNNLETLPESWFNPNPYTQVIDIRNNDIKDIPTFVDYPEIRRLDIRENDLGFEELIPIKQHPRWETDQFDLFPQSEFDLDIDTLITLGEVVTVNIGTGLASNKYALMKDDSKIDDNTTGTFDIYLNEVEDLGEYWVKISNDSFPDPSEFLRSKAFTFVEKPEEPITEKGVLVFSPNGDGIADYILIEGEDDAIFYNKNGMELRKESLPYKWYGDDKKGALQEPGLYVVQKSDGSFIKILIAF